MKEFLKLMMLLFMISCTGIILALGAATAFLVVNGSITGPRLKAAWAALRGKEKPPPPERPSVAQEWRQIEETRTRMGHTQSRREEELRKLQDLAEISSSRDQAERKRLEEARAESAKEADRARKEKEDLAKAKIDAVIEANLPIYEKMKGQELASLMLGWKDPEIVKYLRLLTPRKSSEVLRAMQQETKYTTIDKDAPKGTKSRFELIVAELHSPE